MDATTDPSEPVTRPEYEPPRIERVITADELARDVQYAGGVSVDNDG